MTFDQAWNQLEHAVMGQEPKQLAELFFGLGRTAAMERVAGIEDEALSAAIGEILERRSTG